MTTLCLENLTVLRGRTPTVDDVSLTITPGECVGLLGPNGAGKTTLMRAALGLLPHRGRSSLSGLEPRTRARTCAFIPQNREIAWDMTVEHIIRLGRLPHGGESGAAIDAAIETMGLRDFRQRTATALSGGEQARVLIARALAQETPLLMADEPTAGLDPAAQIATLRVFADLAAAGKAVLLSLHDLGLAARHCSRVLIMNRGRLVADGPPRDVLTPDLLRDVFHVSAHFEMTPAGPVFQTLDVVD